MAQPKNVKIKTTPQTNAERNNGKAFKKKHKPTGKTGRTVGGYSPEKLEIRARRRNKIKKEAILPR